MALRNSLFRTALNALYFSGAHVLLRPLIGVRGNLEDWHWQVTAILALLGLIGIGVWDHVDRRGRLEPFVQTVVQQEDGKLRVYYCVTDSGMLGSWQAFLVPEDET